MAKQQKYYVVWVGQNPGVYDNWNDCKKQVHQFENAKYKSFESRAEADAAFKQGFEKFYKEHPSPKNSAKQLLLLQDQPKPILRSLSVDAAWRLSRKVIHTEHLDELSAVVERAVVEDAFHEQGVADVVQLLVGCVPEEVPVLVYHLLS